MQYSPKLKNAIDEIKAILDKHDIAGLVILHDPGHSEYLVKLNPSYSCANQEGNNLRIKAKLKEDFKGDREAMRKVLADTANMFKLLSETGGELIVPLYEISEALDEKLEAEHRDGGHTSHTTQNN